MTSQIKKFSSRWLGTLGLFCGIASAPAEPWKFGVMADTQWTCPTDPAINPFYKDPNHVAVSIINQLNQEFIGHGVKFVIQVGDLTENGADADIAVRSAAAQALYDAGIGFFPMRGDHETYSTDPVTGLGNNYGIDKFRAEFPQTQGQGGHLFGAENFKSPTLVSADLTGMSYSFDYGITGNNVRILVIDEWVTPGKFVPAAAYPYGYSIADQQDWISGQLDKVTRGTEHAFVLAHQNLIGENHQDTLFTGYANENLGMQNAFFSSLSNNLVGFYISGHDHIHQRSMIQSPDHQSSVQEIICASDSSKFYEPKGTADGQWYGQKIRETSVSQETNTVGYYIYTVDGPRVTVEYYSDNHGGWGSDSSYPVPYPPVGSPGATNQVTPDFTFVKKETWGYSQNGIQKLVAQGAGYALVDDTSKAVANGETGYIGTTAKILDGINGSAALDGSGRHLTKTVNTGWAPAEGIMASDIFTLWGMADLTATKDIYVVSISFSDVAPGQTRKGGVGIATRDASGNWVNAVSNLGVDKKFVKGAYNPSRNFVLGTYGVDSKTRTAWAVVNYPGEFAVMTGIEPSPGQNN